MRIVIPCPRAGQSEDCNYIDFPFVAGADGTKIFQSKKEINPKFLYYSLINLDIPNTGYIDILN
ncbi:hypothetical protein COU00_01365 [Candidatus Falkowbacteria bacterium CG10_big_fil_rev_8_21_14_0_10_43_11]|uniref:Uncharacterized protein n=1 Tax=Candidatus Falkowbacteria bacterium CG10_big_fil_rev_8_21_14_0_10_43_11 TaxID=1974568 RepID=A0A2M6WMG5_9BACT|nr:MAG: hypothetical protein COU00_01365 [Candidatus Falkowbacteria bacterium CG10_big_fil_rev_8_21_14_0_10_43_11]